MNKTIGLIFLIFLILAIISCHDKSNKSVEINPFFQEFLNKIPNRPLPINFSCGLPDQTEFSRDFEKYSSFIPGSADRIFGTIESQSDTHRIIIFGYTGDDIYPVVFLFDNRGIVKDSLMLILHGCGGADKTQIPHSFVLIDNNLTINLIDSTRLIHYPGYWKKVNDLLPAISTKISDSLFVTTGDYIVDSLRISRQVFKIDNEGRFVKQ